MEENKITFSDIVALAKQGYKPSDIKELLNMQIPAATNDPGEGGQKAEENEPPKENPEEPDKEVVNPPEEKKAEATNDKKDDVAKENEELKKKLAEAQQANINKDNSNVPKKTNTEIINDLALNFM